MVSEVQEFLDLLSSLHLKKDPTLSRGVKVQQGEMLKGGRVVSIKRVQYRAHLPSQPLGDGGGKG